MAKVGAPKGSGSKYTPELAAEICARLAKGEPMVKICESAHMPHYNTVDNWEVVHPEFAVAIARARLNGYDSIAAEALEIANTPIEGVEATIKADGTREEKRADMLGHRKLQIETRLKLLAKWDPKRYGERSDVNVTGALTLEQIVQSANEKRQQKS